MMIPKRLFACLGLLMLAAALSACRAPAEEPTATAPPSITYELQVAKFQDIPDYDRDDWNHWTDEDGDCQNARAEVLIAESRGPVGFDDCRVISGDWLGLFTGTTVTDASDLDVDHMVPLSNAHRSGAWSWDAAKKREYANYLTDPDHLIAVTSGANRSKGDKGPEEWRPPDESYWCEYADDWARIKSSWDLAVTQAEFTALTEMLATCDAPVLLTVGEAPPATATATSLPGDLPFDPFGPDRDCGDFTDWDVVSAFYEAAGGPESDPHRLDPDGDGIPCESLR